MLQIVVDVAVLAPAMGVSLFLILVVSLASLMALKLSKQREYRILNVFLHRHTRSYHNYYNPFPSA